MGPTTLLVTAFYPPLLGGLEQYWREVTKRWPADQRLVILTNPHPRQAAYDQSAPQKIIRLNLFSWRHKPSWLPLVWKLPGIIREHKIDRLLFGHYANYVLVGLFIKWTMRTPFRVMTHGIDTMIPRRKLLSRWLMKRVLTGADKLFCNSQYTKTTLTKLDLENKSIESVPPGIELDHYPIIDKSSAKDKLNLDGKFVILTVARLVKLKGVDLVIKALAGLANRSNVVQVIIGDGPEMDDLIKLAKDLGLEQNIRFIGQIEDQPSAKSIWYSAADLYVLATRKVIDHEESFGISYLEAGRYRLPVVASRSGGASELIRHNETGILITPDSESELTAAIGRLIDQPALRHEMGEQLFRLIKNSYTWDQSVKQLSQ